MYTPNQRQNFYGRGNAGAYPKRPLHSFQDLEVYQKALECSVLVGKKIDKFIGSGIVSDMVVKNMLHCALGIPHQVAEAHSLRFGDHTAGIAAIERAMLGCNKMVVYLEQFRDICESGVEWEFFDDTIKKYLYVRRKMLRLEQAWKKFMPEYKEK
ncbi:MAG: hypothetical protein WAP52_00970 [Candidatus Sungiibacteriota bacterium]